MSGPNMAQNASTVYYMGWFGNCSVDSLVSIEEHDCSLGIEDRDRTPINSLPSNTVLIRHYSNGTTEKFNKN